MSLQTRIDGRSSKNNLLFIKDRNGNQLAKIKVVDQAGITLEVFTPPNIYIEKENGWSSKQYKGNKS